MISIPSIVNDFHCVHVCNLYTGWGYLHTRPFYFSFSRPTKLWLVPIVKVAKAIRNMLIMIYTVAIIETYIFLIVYHCYEILLTCILHIHHSPPSELVGNRYTPHSFVGVFSLAFLTRQLSLPCHLTFVGFAVQLAAPMLAKLQVPHECFFHNCTCSNEVMQLKWVCVKLDTPVKYIKLFLCARS